MHNSDIEWLNIIIDGQLIAKGHTFNPWIGCVEVSPACGLDLNDLTKPAGGRCYAKTDSLRFILYQAKQAGVELVYPEGAHPVWGKDSDRYISPNESHWNGPLVWDRSAARRGVRERVFCGSYCDIIERNSKVDDPRQWTYKLIEHTPNLDWLLLTKRPHEYINFLPKEWLKNPKPNVWLLTTVERADYLKRIDQMMKAPAVVYGLSMEGLLGPITLPDHFWKLGKKAWVLVGGETGHQPRPMRPEWGTGDKRSMCSGWLKYDPERFVSLC
jgi:protein gp37